MSHGLTRFCRAGSSEIWWLMKYEVRIGTDAVRTDWEPLAQAAWHRATRDASNPKRVALYHNGALVTTAVPHAGQHTPWPLGPECSWSDVTAAVFQLLRDDEWDTRELAATMTAYGLPTSRARLDGLRGSAGRRLTAAPAEIVVMLYAVIDRYKTDRARAHRDA